MKKLTNPDLNPSAITLNGTSATDKTSFYISDACALATNFGNIDATNGVAFEPAGALTAAALKSFLQVYALVIREFRIQAENEVDLGNNLTAVRTAIDGNSSSEVLTSSDATTPFANNPNLLVVKRPFVYTATTALKIGTTAGTGHDIDVTLTIAAMVPYGALDAWLLQNPIVK